MDSTGNYEIIAFGSGDPGAAGVWDKRTDRMVISPEDFRSFSAFQNWATYADDEAIKNKIHGLEVGTTPVEQPAARRTRRYMTDSDCRMWL